MNKKSEIEELKKEAANQGMVVDSAAEMRAGVVLESCDIFKGCNEIIILHAGEQYRLRITRAGKLILNK